MSVTVALLPPRNLKTTSVKATLILLMAEILHQLIGSLSHYLQGFIHPRWCRISAINSRSKDKRKPFCSCQDFGFLQCFQFPTQSGNVLIKPSALSRSFSHVCVMWSRKPTHPWSPVASRNSWKLSFRKRRRAVFKPCLGMEDTVKMTEVLHQLEM